MPPAFVQSTGSTSTSQTYGSNNTLGNMLLAFSEGGALPTDTAGNTWVQILSFVGGGTTIEVFWVKSCKAGPNTVTSASGFGLMIAEYSGVDTLGLFTNNSAGSGTAITSGSISPTQNNLLLVAGARGGSGTGTTYSGFAPFNGRATDVFPTSQLFDQVNVSPGSYQFSATASSNSSWGAFVIAFYLASAQTYSVPDSRAVTATTPNSSRAVQGTKIYDVQKAESRTQGAPVDSRVSSIVPVDSRTAANIPQNSRTPGVYGPGVN